MNIFVLDKDPRTCAQYHCDKHVIKMILESTQMVCTVLNERGIFTPYKPTHKNHPCVNWLRESDENISWLRRLTFWLNDEYKYRFNKTENHKSFNVMGVVVEDAILSGKLAMYKTPKPTLFALCMPDYCKMGNDAVSSYRNYYMTEKRHIATWTKRGKPEWWKTV